MFENRAKEKTNRGIKTNYLDKNDEFPMTLNAAVGEAGLSKDEGMTKPEGAKESAQPFVIRHSLGIGH